MSAVTDHEAFIATVASIAAERRSGLGGSDCAAALGLSPYKTPATLWAEKRGLIEPEDLSNNVAVELGVRLEQICADMYAERNGVKVHRVNQTLRHPDHSWMMAHIDRRVVGDRKGLECKTAGLVSGRPDPDWGDGGDAIPPVYLLQIQHYLAITGYEAFDVAAIVAGKGYIPYTIARDDELIAMIIAEEAKFWQMVVDGIEPDIVNVEDARRRWPKSIMREVEATPQILVVDSELRGLEEQRKKIESAIDEHQTALMAYMGEYDTLISGKQKLRTWKSQSATRCDVTALKAERPDIYEHFSKTSESRVFRKMELK